MINNPFDDFLIEERLDKNKHLREVSNFCCGNEPLDSFLKTEAFHYNNEGQGITYLLKCIKTKNIIGYYTLKTNAIQIYSIEKNIVESLPSIEIARLAIHHTYQDQGFGTAIFFNYILPKINKVKTLVGLNTIMVFAIDENLEEYKYKKDTKRFYQKLGFRLAEDEVQNFIKEDYSEGCKLMYLFLHKA